MKRIVPRLLLVIVVTTYVSGDPSVTSSPQNVTSVLGGTATFDCEFQDQGDLVVSWWFWNHHLQITYGMQVVTSDNRYAVQTENGRSVLTISSVELRDAGHYRCDLTGTELSQTHTLIIPETTPFPGIEVPPVNFTDCCLEHDVSAACLPLCYPRGVDAAIFDSTVCTDDLQALITCGTDGRNHVPCCLRRMVPEFCLPFCANDLPSDLVSRTFSSICLQQASPIIECYEEGQFLLPGTPQSLEVEFLGFTTVRVRWQPPEENGHSVVGYRLHYQESRIHSFFNSTNIIPDLMYDLHDLTYGSAYKVYVVAIGTAGSSLPSYTLEFHLQTTVIESNQGALYDHGLVLECCHNIGISAACIPVLCSSSVTEVNHNNPAIWGCFSEYNLLYECMALQGDHSVCCQGQGLPEPCLSMCAGHPPSTQSQLQCLSDPIPSIILACVESDSDLIPGPPTAVHLGTVTASTSRVIWSPPLRNPELVTEYVVYYQREGGNTPSMVRTTEREVTLDNLESSTHYTVSIISEGANGTSLASEEITFLTYFAEGSSSTDGGPSTYRAHSDMSAEVPYTPGPVIDMQGCCENLGVPAGCQDLCSYDVDLSAISGEHTNCLSDFGKLLACGAGGRNHTDCCVDRGMAAVCLDFCALSQSDSSSFTFQITHLPCLAVSADIIQCMEEGQGLIPTSPENVEIYRRTNITITVVWSPPASVPDPPGLNAYYVQHRQMDTQEQWHTENVGVRLNHILQNLSPDTVYEIQVLAASVNGTSLPSPRLAVRTLPAASDSLLPSMNFTTPGDVSACCASSNVTITCQRTCTGTDSLHIHDCATQLPAILSCATGGADHRPCCERENVPAMCLGFCRAEYVPIGIPSMACLEYMAEILSCIHQGYGLLPSWPQAFHAEHITPHYLTFVWEAPASNGDGVKYMLYYKENNQTSYVHFEDVSSPINLSRLCPGCFYSVYVIAYNDHGTSQPTPTIELRTLRIDVPSVQVSQHPENYLTLGMNVTLRCVAYGEPMPTVAWLHPNGELTPGDTLHVIRIGRNQGGRYSCVADNGLGGVATGDVYVKLQFTPVVNTPEPVVYVEADRGKNAVLVCLIEGYPPQDGISWTKNHNPISSGGRRLTRVTDLVTDGLLQATLIIEAVSSLPPSDYATYSCHITSTYGNESQDIVLTSPDTAGPIVPAPPVLNVTACCIQHAVQQQCMAACSFDIDLTVLDTQINPITCAPDLQTLAVCAADGRDNTQCCSNASVPSFCWPLCAGLSIELSANHLMCLQHIEVIVNCMESGNARIPSRPRNIDGYMTDDGYLLIRWQSPQVNADAVQQYIIVAENDVTGTNEITVPGTWHEYNLPNTHANTEYTVHVFASNHYGRSGPSNAIRITTRTDIAPSHPRTLRVSTAAPTHLTLTWLEPEEYPGAVLSYIVYYRPVDSDDTYHHIQTNSSDLNYTLSNLEPNINYEVYVTSLGSHSESDPSVTAIFHTSHSAVAAHHNVMAPKCDMVSATITSRVVSDGHNEGSIYCRRPGDVGLAFGIVVSLLCLILIIVLASIWWKRRKLQKSNRHDDSVAFENPAFANTGESRVRGLPMHKDEQPLGHSSEMGEPPYTSNGRGSSADNSYINPAEEDQWVGQNDDAQKAAVTFGTPRGYSKS